MNLLETRFLDSENRCLYFPYEGNKERSFCSINELRNYKGLPSNLREELEFALYYFYLVQVLPILDYAELVARNKYRAHWYLYYYPKEEINGK